MTTHLADLLKLPPPATDAEVAAWDRERRQETLVVQWHQGCPPDWRWARWGNAKWADRIHRAIVDATTKWLCGHCEGGLVMLGPTGCGKSTAMLASLRGAYRAALNGTSPAPTFMWTTEAALCSASRQWPLGRGEPPLYDRCRATDVVVVDECGVGEKGTLFELVNDRYERGKATSLTSGLTVEGFVARYGAALWRRLTELGTVVDCA